MSRNGREWLVVFCAVACCETFGMSVAFALAGWWTPALALLAAANLAFVGALFAFRRVGAAPR